MRRNLPRKGLERLETRRHGGGAADFFVDLGGFLGFGEDFFPQGIKNMV